MDKICSVCGSPMTRTSTGYKCTFCTNTEPLGQTTAQSSTGNGKYRTQSNTGNRMGNVQTSGRMQTTGYSKNKKKKSPVGFIVVAFIFVLSLVTGFRVAMNLSTNPEPEEAGFWQEANVEDTGFWQDEDEIFSESGEKSPAFGFQTDSMRQAVEQIFQKPADEVTKEDVERVRYLAVRNSKYDNCVEVSYSFEDYKDYVPDGLDPELFAYNEDFLNTIETILVSLEDYEGYSIYEDVHNFYNISALALDTYRDVDLSNCKNLTYIDCSESYFEDLEETAVPVGNIEALKLGNASELTGLTNYSSLKTLEVHYDDVDKLAGVADSLSLETLYCTAVEEGQSLQMLKEMTSLKNLYIEGYSDSVKDLSVLSFLTNLEKLAVVNTEIMNIDFLYELTGLKCLYLEENGALVDFTPLGELTNLEMLSFGLGGLNGEQPQYSVIENLTNLKKLYLDTVYDLDFLYALTGLEELEIHLCFYNNLLEPISQMTKLQRLVLDSCYSQYPDGFACLKNLPDLTSLTVIDLEAEESADGLFQLENLEELSLQGVVFYTPPSDIVASDKLKKLELINVSYLVMPGADSEYYYVGYNDENMSQEVLNAYGNCTSLESLRLERYAVKDFAFLQKLGALKSLSMPYCEIEAIGTDAFTGCGMLEELDLQYNVISDLSFAFPLTKLRSLNIEDCYVTDLTPLLSCEQLKYVNAKANPISQNPLSGVIVVQ